jgi:DNA-binding NtrC family response regulator
VSCFISRYAAKTGRAVYGVTAEAEAIRSYDWPGNVRELENAIQHAIVFGSTCMVRKEDLPAELLENADTAGAETFNYHAAMREAKRRLFRKAMARTNGNRVAAAALLDPHPKFLQRALRKLELHDLAQRCNVVDCGNHVIRREHDRVRPAATFRDSDLPTK